MSRESVESLAVVRVSGERLPPPDCLTAAEGEIWRRITAGKPPEWFTDGDSPLLEDYCRLVVALRVMDVESKPFQEGSRLKMALARSLRLTQQSRYTPDKAAAHAKRAGNEVKKPWDSQQRS